MILTGKQILKEIKSNRIKIEPFDPMEINPNSYNYRIGSSIERVITKNNPNDITMEKLHLNKGRWLLKRGFYYLANTKERIGSECFVTSLIGRSSIGRLGLFVQISANVGHQGSFHRWTLELRPSLDIFVYPNQVLGQVSFWTVRGEHKLYTAKYGTTDNILISKLHNLAS